MLMVKKHSLWIILRAVFAILYALFLLLLILTFFYNYGGEWMRKVAEKLPIKEMNFNINKQIPEEQ